MTFEFGPLQLDEPGRVVRVAAREVPLQPRIFDLLAYLVRNRERVVPKEELLDILWPGVTVTDNSLQRAVSVLRAALRERGLQDAIRNFPRNGYRFCTDNPPPHVDRRQGGGRLDVDSVGAARQAMKDRRWADADTLYQGADGENALSGPDLDGWALALQCLGRPLDAVPVLVRAVTEHSRLRDLDCAAESAATLSGIHLERGEAAVAAGWLSRARDLIGGRSDSVVAGQIFWIESRLAAFGGDPRRALELAEAAYDHGRRHDNVRITALGLMYRGFYRLSLGKTREGLSDQDHAATLALSNNVDPITGGVLYCNVLWACRTFGDWARANQWTLSYQKFCEHSGMQFSGSCQLHRAEVLGVRGTLSEALEHVSYAISHLKGDAPWALGDAHRVLGDIHAAIGNVEAAFAAYQTCYSLGWCPEPGHALLLLERGDLQAAVACLERSLIGQSWWTLQRQSMLLAHLALVLAHAGEHDRAQTLIEDLAGQDSRWPMPSIRALTSEASAVLALGRGDPKASLRHLHLARQLWTSIDAQFSAARLRLRIAECSLDLGDTNGAAAEILAACATAETLSSDKLREKCRAIQHRYGEHEHVGT